jgi:hypothetical protein
MGKKGGLVNWGVSKYLQARFSSKELCLALAGTVEGGLFPVVHRVRERDLIGLTGTEFERVKVVH